ncbi:hypothetical protein [Roseibium sp.]|uniref:hypothetical protein n=1 Tax=Roseibium sp. TaxID=1936156 RepID=UPI003D0EA2B5
MKIAIRAGPGTCWQTGSRFVFPTLGTENQDRFRGVSRCLCEGKYSFDRADAMAINVRSLEFAFPLAFGAETTVHRCETEGIRPCQRAAKRGLPEFGEGASEGMIINLRTENQRGQNRI